MTDTPQNPPEEKYQRASLRGLGWAIMRGDESPAQPTPEEETLDFDAIPQEFAFGDPDAWQAAPEKSKLAGERSPAANPGYSTESLEVQPKRAIEAIPRVEIGAQTLGGPVISEYAPKIEVGALVPHQPETMSALTFAGDGGGIHAAIAETPVIDLEAERAFIQPQDVRIDVADLTSSVATKRPTADDLFSHERDLVPADDLLDMFVTDERLQDVWQDIEALQAELADSVQGDRALMDAYQQELLQASALLMQDRANYDDVRAILYRIRVDLARDDKTRSAIQRYKPRVLGYLALMLALWLVLMALEPLFDRFVTEVLGFQALNLIYHAALFGMLGALVNGYFTLNKHTIQQRDFDPSHLSWYLMNPVVGIIMGLMMALVFGTGIISTIGVATLEQPDVTVTSYPFLMWMLCFLAGYNQNTVLNLLQKAFNILRGEEDDDDDDSVSDMIGS